MATIKAAKARTLPERIEDLETAMAGLPPWDRYQWIADTKQAFGDKRVRAHVVGDDGYGEGRQWIAAVPGDNSFGTLADYIAAANPDTVRLLLNRIAELEARLSVERFFLAHRSWNGSFVLIPWDLLPEYDAWHRKEVASNEAPLPLPAWAREVDLDLLTFANPVEHKAD